MRSKAPLALMEQVIMVLVFALAAALCLRCFVWADQRSKRDDVRDHEMILIQNAAEAVKASHGNMAQAASRLGAAYPYGYDRLPFSIHYDADWNVVPERPADGYSLVVQPAESGVDGLGKAEVGVWSGQDGLDRNGEAIHYDMDLCEHHVTVCWQEVSGDG